MVSPSLGDEDDEVHALGAGGRMGTGAARVFILLPLSTDQYHPLRSSAGRAGVVALSAEASL